MLLAEMFHRQLNLGLPVAILVSYKTYLHVIDLR